MKAGSEGSITAHSQAQKEKDRAQQKLASDTSAAGLEGSSTALSQAQKERAVARVRTKHTKSSSEMSPAGSEQSRTPLKQHSIESGPEGKSCGVMMNPE